MLEATSQRGPNQKKSARGVKGSRDLAVRTQLMEGSVWSMEVAFWEENLVKSYYLVSIRAVLCSMKWKKRYLVRNNIPMPRHHIKRTMILLYSIILPIRLIHNTHSSCKTSSIHATGCKKSLGFANP